MAKRLPRIRYEAATAQFGERAAHRLATHAQVAGDVGIVHRQRKAVGRQLRAVIAGRGSRTLPTGFESADRGGSGFSASLRERVLFFFALHHSSQAGDPMQSAAALWTGGKDSLMALHEAAHSGLCIRCLVTFAPPGGAFLAHPVAFLRMQAETLALPHYILPVTEPFADSYEAGLARLHHEMGLDCVVTGDIAEVDGYPNWIRQRSRGVGIGVHTPLWGRDRYALLRQLVDRGYRALICCVDTRHLDASWIARELNESTIAQLREMGKLSGLDPCGEQGEYHTLVLDGPAFVRPIDIRSYTRRAAGPLAYMAIESLELKDSCV